MVESSELRKARAARLKAARIEAGYNRASDFARALNRDKEVMGDSTYRSYENASRTITYGAAKILAAALGVEASWLLEGGRRNTTSGVDVAKKSVESETIPATSGSNVVDWRRDLPVKGMAECGPDGWSWLNGETIELTERPPNLAGALQAFAVYIQGDSMHPAIPQGAMAYIHPGRPIGIGDYVLVELKAAPGESTPKAILKLLVKRSPSKIILEQLNPPRMVEVKTGEIEHIYKVVGLAFR